MDDTYYTIRQEARAESKVKGSRFIGETFFVTTVDDALARLTTVRKREYNATHHCYAYIVGLGNETVFKYSDDGEPSGTAGKPIYDIVAADNLTGVLCVVTRYYGGTKLGTGGLVRAYGGAAKEVMQLSGVATHYLTTRFRITVDFSLYDRLQKLLHRIETTVVGTEFTDTVSVIAEIRDGRADSLTELVIELTAGKGVIERIKKD
ncbi:MAG: YigZ family protein [candidate division Zixibacteria bacterium]|nr:YigZ family protein [candidate division Zixibacteria bacterium]